MSNFKFSIIIPVNNSTFGIEKTLNSLINQSLDFEENTEVILISNDDFKNALNEYLDKYPNNIKYFQNDSPIAKNLGIEKASGEYINFLECGDYISENTLKDLLDYINTDFEADLIAIPLYYYRNGRKEAYLNYPIKDSREIDFLSEPSFAQILGPSTFVKRKSVKDIRFLNEYNEDITFYNEILMDNPRLGICKKGNYFIENIDERTLPTEEKTIDNDQYLEFVESNLNSLIAKSENEFSEVPEFVQYGLLNQIRWISSIKKSKDYIDLEPLKRIAGYVDDEIIMDNLLINDDTKIFIFKLKYGNLNDELKDELNLNTVFIDNYDIVNSELNILANLTNVSDRNVEVNVNGNKVETKEVRFPQKDRISLGHTYAFDYSFEVKIPLATTEQYELEFECENKTLDIDFSRPCNFSRFAGYAKTRNYISIWKNNKLIVKKKTVANWLGQEFKGLLNMAKHHKKDFIKAMPFRVAYMLGYPFLKNRRIWFYMDRPDESDDNGIHLFKYAVDKDKDIDKYYILSSDNRDIDEIKKVGKVITYKSLKHRYLGLFAENIITSHPDNEIIYPFWGGYPFFAGLLKSNNIFLQHGIIKDDISSWLHKANMNLSFFLVSSRKEYESIFKYPYNYDRNVVQMLGLPRYDNLENVEGKRQIIIMPTWRRVLTRKSSEYISNTEYFKRFNSLINNERLIEKAREHGYEIIFRPHPKVYDFIELFDENDYVKIDYEKVKYQTLFNNGSLLITDYSSVAFDFAYLYKPVLYYQYGDDYHFDMENNFFDYETMGLGEICRDEEELVDAIIEYMENDCKIKEEYSKRIEEFYVYTDKNNCKRVHEAIKEVPLKD